MGVFVESTVQWTDAFRSVVGARFDEYWFDVANNFAANSGTTSDHVASPKLSLIFRPWTHTELFANYGHGFHSNDARGTTETIIPSNGAATEPVTPLVKTRGEELGIRSEWITNLQSSLALWRLDLDSELVFSGDAGTTEPTRPSRRYGVELNNHYIASDSLLFDLDVALSHARYTDGDSTGAYIPDAIEQVASFGATVNDWHRWFGHAQLRYFGSRPLIEDNRVRSHSTLLAYFEVGHSLSKDTKLKLDVFNLFSREANDIEYYYTSRLPGEHAEGSNDFHFHPVEPRTFRLSLVHQL
jgi:outer membrane receptor protein involved in Fe transport